MFVSFVKGGRRIAGGLCGCFELDDEVREGDAERGLGIVWQEEGGDGGYFGSPKEKVRLWGVKRGFERCADSGESFNSIRGRGDRGLRFAEGANVGGRPPREPTKSR